MKTLFDDFLIIFPDRSICRGYVTAENGKITETGTGAFTGKADETVHGHGMYLCPGFVDIHVHGADGYEFIDGTEEAFTKAMRAHLLGGTTTIVPTFSSADIETYRTAIAAYGEIKASWNEKSGLPRPGGIHMEGPYFSEAQAGAQDPSVIRAPKKEEYEYLLSLTDDIVRWAAAPELDGAMEFAGYLSSRGIGVSIGHSDATSDTADEALKNGFSSVTHLYSGCSLVHRNGPFREGGVVESALKNSGLDVEIIADGAHLPRELLELIYRVKGPEHIALVTDCIRCGGHVYPDGTVIPYDKKRNIDVTIERSVAVMPGRKSFAGSLATTSHLVRTMVRLAGTGLADAVYMAAAVPARLIGKDDTIGSVAPGRYADFTILDGDLEVSSVYIGGQRADR